MDARGRDLLAQYVALASKQHMLDSFFEREGTILDPTGEPLPAMRTYVAVANAAGRALARLETHLAESGAEAGPRVDLSGLSDRELEELRDILAAASDGS